MTVVDITQTLVTRATCNRCGGHMRLVSGGARVVDNERLEINMTLRCQRCGGEGGYIGPCPIGPSEVKG